MILGCRSLSDVPLPASRPLALRPLASVASTFG